MNYSLLEKKAEQTLDNLMTWFAQEHDNFFFVQKKIHILLG